MRDTTLTFTISIPLSEALLYVSAALLFVFAGLAMVTAVKLYVEDGHNVLKSITLASIAFALIGLAFGGVWTQDLAQALKFTAFMVAWLLVVAIPTLVACNWRAVMLACSRVLKVELKFHWPRFGVRRTA